MKRIFASILLVVAISCKPDKPLSQVASATESTPEKEIAMVMHIIENSPSSSEPYELKVQMNKLENDVYDFMVSMKLNGGSHFVSPNAKRDFKGKFTIIIDDTNNLIPISDLIETPLSVAEIDPHPFVNGEVNWVRVNTDYKLQLQRNVETDFIVTGLIQFTIEPRCTLEKIPIIIKYEAGEMTVMIDNC